MKSTHRVKIAARLERAAPLFADVDRMTKMLTRMAGHDSDINTRDIKQRAEDLVRLLQIDIPDLLEAAKPCDRPHVRVTEEEQ